MELRKIIFKNVQEIINNNDPVGLVDGGAPDDEYDNQVGQIVEALRTESDRVSLANKIESIFKSSFGEDCLSGKEQYLQISEKLLEMKNRLRW